MKSNIKRRHIYLPLFSGILSFYLVIFFLQVFIGNRSTLDLTLDIFFRHFKAFLLVILISSIPFVAQMLLIWIVSFKSRGRRLESIFWGGFVSIFGPTLFGHYIVWNPLYTQDERISSTAILAYIFIPLYCLLFLVIGSIIGWSLSFFPWLKDG